MARDPKTGRFPKGSGIPASGGWGGPARGAGGPPIKPGDPEGIQRMSNDPDIRARKIARAAEMEDVLYGIAKEIKAPEMARINAAAKLHAIYEGTPIARTITATVADPNSLTDADLAAIAAGGRTAADPAPADPVEPGGVVH